MNNSVQIKIDKNELIASEKNLSSLSAKLTNRKLNLSVTKCKGGVANDLIKIINQLNDIGENLSELVKKTETAVRNTRTVFVETDEALRQFWSV